MKRILFAALLVTSSCTLMSQPSASTAAPSLDPAVPVTLGSSVVALNGPWKFHTGDDPQWASPSFDDSAWQSYELMPGHPSLTPDKITQTHWLPGWEHHGHPGYTGYAWYRIRLRLPQNVPSLSLLMPKEVDDAYEVYINGSKIGEFGHLNGWPLTYAGQPEIFSVPAAALDSGQPVTLALRFWNSRYEASPTEREEYGGLCGLPVIGPSSLLQVLEQSVRQQTRQYLGDSPLINWITGALYFSVGLISFFLFLFSRDQQEYLWAGISLTGFGVMLASILTSIAPQTLIPTQICVLTESPGLMAAAFAMPLTAMYLLNVPRPFWRRANYFAFALLAAWVLQNAGFFLGLLPPTAAMERLYAVTLWLAWPLLAFLLLAIAIDGVWTIGRKAWLPMTPGLLFALYCNLYMLHSLGILKGSFFFPRVICASVPVAVLIIFLMRFAQQQRENVRLADDMRQAREMQQLMIPEKLPRVPWLAIESEYLPAREVGGDFFQIIPLADTSVLIVAGDVTGHGLQAGMLVALLVGAVRTESAHTSDPVKILKALNARLYGREHAQATCLVLKIESAGNAMLANAGHLPPYLNGRTLEMEGALPLGMIDGAEFPLMLFHLSQSDRLTMISDGVVEARSRNGELFGFDRTAAISTQSANQIAKTAELFGQEDDITVLTLEFAGAGVANA